MITMLTSVLPPWHWGTFLTGLLLGAAIVTALRIIEEIFDPKKRSFYVINLSKVSMVVSFESRRVAERHAMGCAAVTKDLHAVAEGVTWFDKDAQELAESP